ncbi:MAG: type II toxin-antitoxin system RelE/ParE family toxin [Proteobacteria bacterium]|nr:type II toxin-antitoxin system RelE/ParE family toxin [Pseudomonadota bacterium]
MIRSFHHRGLKRPYERGDRSQVDPNYVEKIEVILADLDAANSINHMRRPGYRLHRLTGGLKGFQAVDVSGNWRIVFRFDKGDVFDVDLLDYH